MTPFERFMGGHTPRVFRDPNDDSTVKAFCFFKFMKAYPFDEDENYMDAIERDHRQFHEERESNG